MIDWGGFLAIWWLASAPGFFPWLLLRRRYRFVFEISVVDLAWSCMGMGAALVAGLLQKFSSILVLCTFLLLLISKFYIFIVTTF